MGGNGPFFGSSGGPPDLEKVGRALFLWLPLALVVLAVIDECSK
jgi:hypothetical protein